MLQALARPVGLGLEAESCGERYRRLLSEAQREWQDAQRAVAAEEEAEAEGEAASRTMAEGEREPEELEEEEEDDAFEDELGTETEEEEVPFGGEEGPEGDDVGEGDPAEARLLFEGEGGASLLKAGHMDGEGGRSFDPGGGRFLAGHCP